jgi:biopolymer transport protein ExbD
MTPLVDVMLVLLIIFLITSQIILQSVKIDLPKAVNIPTQTKPENITLAVDKEGNIYWNDGRVANREDLIAHVRTVAVVKPQLEIHLRADEETRFDAVGRVMYAIQRGGSSRWDSSWSLTAPCACRRVEPHRGTEMGSPVLLCMVGAQQQRRPPGAAWRIFGRRS